MDGHFRQVSRTRSIRPGSAIDHRVRLERDHGGHVVKIGAHLGVVRQHVADDIETACHRRALRRSRAQRLDLAKFVVAHAQAIARLAGVNASSAKGEGRAHPWSATGGSEQFGTGQYGNSGHGGLAKEVVRRKACEGRGRMRQTRILTDSPDRLPMSEDILINFTPQETRVAVHVSGCRAGAAYRNAPRVAVWWAMSMSDASCAFCPACNRRSSTSGGTYGFSARRRHLGADRVLDHLHDDALPSNRASSRTAHHCGAAPRCRRRAEKAVRSNPTSMNADCMPGRMRTMRPT